MTKVKPVSGGYIITTLFARELCGGRLPSGDKRKLVEWDGSRHGLPAGQFWIEKRYSGVKPYWFAGNKIVQERENPISPQGKTLTLTFAQWQSKYGMHLVSPVGDRFAVVGAAYDFSGKSELWQLSDYVVTSVTGGSIWLSSRA